MAAAVALGAGWLGGVADFLLYFGVPAWHLPSVASQTSVAVSHPIRLFSAVAMLGQLESAGPDDLAPGEKAKELVLFSISPEYFRLREAIGITLRLQ